MINQNSIFGSEKEYKSLVCIHTQFLLLERKDQKYLSTILSDFNRIILKVTKVRDSELFNYLINSVRNDFINRIKQFYYNIKDRGAQDSNILVTHVENLIVAKIRQSINENKKYHIK